MGSEKNSTDEPTVVTAATTQDVTGLKFRDRLRKKHVVIAVFSLLITGLLVTAVLVGIRMFTDSDLEQLKYSLQANGVNQNTSTDGNSVIYHVTKGDEEAWILDDFDRGLKVSKTIIDGTAICYVTALNKSMAADATSIPSTTPKVDEDTPSDSVIYKVMPEPIDDISFLGHRASKMCYNIPTYHAIPDCGESTSDINDIALTNTTDGRTKRTPAFCARCNLPNCLCACGCCSLVCARFASTRYISQYIGGRWYCTYYVYQVYAVYGLQGCSFYGRYYNP